MGDQVVHDARVGLATVRTRVLRCHLTLQIFMTVDETEVKGDWINREQRAGRLQGSGSTDTSSRR